MEKMMEKKNTKPWTPKVALRPSGVLLVYLSHSPRRAPLFTSNISIRPLPMVTSYTPAFFEANILCSLFFSKKKKRQNVVTRQSY